MPTLREFASKEARRLSMHPGVIGLILATAMAASSAADSFAADGDRAPDLVRRLYEDGSWTAALSSLYLRSEVIQTEAKASRESPTRHLIEFVFDSKRLRYECRFDGDFPYTTVILWDGKEGKHSMRTKDHESYQFCDDIGSWGWIELWGQHEWANIGGYSFWWDSKDPQAFLSANFLLPEDFTSAGREVFAGTECDLVESKAGFVRLCIGVTDRRLRGKIHYFLDSKRGGEAQKLIRAIGKEKGASIETTAQWHAWLKTLDPVESRRLKKRLAEALFELGVLKARQYSFSDYRELGPGRWVPSKARMENLDIDGGRFSGAGDTSETTILELKVDEPLPDDLFRLELKAGVQVADFRFDLPEGSPLTYSYEPGRTEAELQALHEAARKDLEKHRKGYVDLTRGVEARVGERPREFPETTWLNSKPLAWKDLEGKVVVLEFWAEDCEASLGDFQVFQKAIESCVEEGIAVIGVHKVATKEKKKDIEKAIAANKISIPICIDTPGPAEKGFGELTQWFGIDGVGGKMFPYLGGNGVIRIPYAVLVGKDGLVAHHGYLWDMLAEARKLAKAPGGGVTPAPARPKPPRRTPAPAADLPPAASTAD